MKNFADFNLPQNLTQTLKGLDFTAPTPIQAQAIPHALDGRDILGSAQTGTGKTAAFMIPVLAKLLQDETQSALIMSPTRELATQIMDMTRKLMGHKSGIRTALLIGGEPMFKQFKQLSARPRLIIGTPGRIDDHCRRNRALLDTTHTLVLDEADRMLDMGFSTQIDSILKYMPQERHTLMFSATFSDKIVKFARTYLHEPVRVAVKPEKITADRIKHDVLKLRSKEDKFPQLLQELEEREGSVIIFVKTRRNADALAKKLNDTGNDSVHAEPIHGDLRQRQRDRTIKGFQLKHFRILVATDVAARGLDVPHVEHVINYDLPQNPEDYIHRIGRTARAGAAGQAVCFVTSAEGRDWSIIERMVFPHARPSFEAEKHPFKQETPRKGRGKAPFRGGSKHPEQQQSPYKDRPPGSRFKKFADKPEGKRRDSRKPAGPDSAPSAPARQDSARPRYQKTDRRSEKRADKPAERSSYDAKKTPRSEAFKKSGGFKKKPGYGQKSGGFQKAGGKPGAKPARRFKPAK